MESNNRAIKRVISDPEQEFGRKSQKSQRVHSPEPSAALQTASFLAQADHQLMDMPMDTPMDVDTTAAIHAPAIIEQDDDHHDQHPMVDTNRPMSHIDKAGSRTSTTSSSLSDDRSNGVLESMGGGSRNNINESRTSMIRNDSRLSTDSSASMLRSVENSSGNWGWFEDVHGTEGGSDNKRIRKGKNKGGLFQSYDDALPQGDHDIDSEVMGVTAPTYVLEESLSSQQLWKHTAGTRPPQPVEERAFFEKMWAQNFARSQVDYHMPVEVLTAKTPISLSPFADGNFSADSQAAAAAVAVGDYGIGPNHNANDYTSRHEEVALMRRLHDPRQARHIGIQAIGPHHQQHVVNKKIKSAGSESSMTVHVRGDNVFGTTVSKSFARKKGRDVPLEGVDTVNISVASYRVVETKRNGKFAQFLVIYREGSIRDTIGVWKRYSDFVELSRKVMEAHISCVSVLASMSPLASAATNNKKDGAGGDVVEHLPNAITSWRLLKKRQRWYRCLDAGYLSLKVFLLERFLHDILFESSTPKLLREFVGVTTSANNKNNTTTTTTTAASTTTPPTTSMTTT